MTIFFRYSLVSLRLLVPVCALSSCALTPEQVAQAVSQRMEPKFADSQIVPVYVATNREKTGTPGCQDSYFGVAAGPETSFAVCEVNVPRRHAVGALDESDDSQPDPHTYFSAGKLRPVTQPEFSEALGSANEVLVFVHGFNVKFAEATYRAAQMKYDLKFPGPIVLFSWPAGAEQGFFQSLRISNTYDGNLFQARASRNAFREFLHLLNPKARIHLLVHSMGHQVVLPALATPGETFNLQELVLNAPDFATDDFKQIAPQLRKVARRITLYCSPGDNALVASERANNNRRIGRCERVDGIDVINVNEVDTPALGIAGLGHGYYSGRPILTDVFQILLGIDARSRLFVRVSAEGGGENYVLRK